MDKTPIPQFGKRPQAVISPGAEPVKRSHHVALLVMGTLAVGGGAYALSPKENCSPNNPAMATPSSPQAAPCYGSGSRSGGWHTGFFYGGSGSSGTSSASGSSETTRGGFGSFGRAFAAHFSGS
jgi:hypothetical protein